MTFRKSSIILIISSLLLLLFLYMVSGCGSENSRFKEEAQYQKLISSSLENSYHKAQNFLKEGELDSAYIYFANVANRYKPNMSRNDKLMCQAVYNNMAYIAHTYFYDYPLAYEMAIKSLEIANETDHTSVIPSIYLNIGNLMYSTGNWEEAMNFHHKAIEVAKENNDTLNYIKGYVNLITEAFLKNRLDDYKDIIYNFPVDSVSEAIHKDALFSYAYKFNKVAFEEINHRHDRAIKELENLQKEDTLEIVPKERLKFFRLFITSKIYAHNDDPGMERKVLKDIESEHLITPELKAYLYEALADNYKNSGQIDSAAKYRLELAEIKDSLLSENKRQSIYDMRQTYQTRAINFRLESLLREKSLLLNSMIVISIFTAVILILLVFLIISRRRILKTNREIYAKNRDILKELDKHKNARQNVSDDQTAKISTEDPMTSDDKKLLDKIIDFFESSDEIYKQDFSIEKFGAILGVPVRKLSKIINEGTGQNFSNLVQIYRIRECCRRLSDFKNYSNYTIEAIAESLGFKSRSNFNAIFKKITGLTPATYQKIAKEEDRKNR